MRCQCGHIKEDHNYKPSYTNKACIFMTCNCLQFEESKVHKGDTVTTKKQMTVEEIVKLLESKATTILHYHDKEGRTTEELVFHRARFNELAEWLLTYATQSVERASELFLRRTEQAIDVAVRDTTKPLVEALEKVKKIRDRGYWKISDTVGEAERQVDSTIEMALNSHYAKYPRREG